MAIVFPASPSVNETFTVGSITYKWDGDKWIGLGVTPADRLIEGSNSLEINASNQLVWSGGNVGVNNTSPGARLQVDYDEGAGEVGLRLRAYNATNSKSWNISEVTGNAGVLTFRNATNVVDVLSLDGINSRVGIGVTNPSNKFQVEAGWANQNTNNIANFGRTGNLVNVTIGYDDTATSMYLGTGTNHPLQLRINNTEVARLKSTGLEVAGTSSTSATSDTPLYVNSPPGKISIFVGELTSTSGFGVNDYSGTIRFNGSDVAWGDISYYPNGNDGNGSFRFTRNGSTVTSTPNATIGCSGISFAGNANASGMTSELLDDYEEGTWTPTLLGTSTDPTVTYTARSARYTKIGNQVTVWCYLRINTVSGGSGNLNIGGLPFNNANAAQASEGATFMMNYYNNWTIATGNFPMGYVRNNDDKIYVIIGGTGGAVTTYAVTSLNNDLLLYGNATYFANI